MSPFKKSPRGKFVKIDTDDKKTKERKEKIFKTIIANLTKYLNNHANGAGIWYPEDYMLHLYKEAGVKGITEETDLSGKIPLIIYEGYADPNYWDRFDTFAFMMKEGKIPSDALMSFLKGPTIADCGNATVAIYYKTILDLLGKEKFNELFAKNFVIQMMMISDVDHMLMEFRDGKELVNVPHRKPLSPGDHLHFEGIRWYANKHPAGFEGGWNVIYVGDNSRGEQLFVGHGFASPFTEKQINENFVKYYNLKRTLKDWEFIKKSNDPDLYDADKNLFLREHYTLTNEEVHKNPKKYLGGFIEETMLCIKPDILGGKGGNPSP